MDLKPAPLHPAILIPCFRGEGHVGKVVREALRHVESVLVVDDGSDDASAAEATAAGAQLFIRPENGGKGAAIQDGLRRLLGDASITHVLFMDADGQHAPSDIPRFLEAARQSHPFVIGSRFGDRAKIPPKRFWTNYIGSKVLTRMTGQPVEDSQSGYRMIAAPVLREVLPSLHSTGYSIESEILIKAAAKGVPFSHVPIETIYDGNPSHFRPVLDTWRISRLCIQFKVFETD